MKRLKDLSRHQPQWGSSGCLRWRQISTAAVAVTVAIALGIIALSLTTALAAADDGSSDHINNKIDSNVYLDSDSVVLITGAAGFLGSELAMALHRTYRPRKIICIDSMDAGFGESGVNATTMSETADLALFEFKRQRVFHLLQQQQDEKSTTFVPSIFFYRVDFRPSIPEFFDTSEVPVLHHIFEEHADITHVVHLADHVHRAPLVSSSTSSSSTTTPITRATQQQNTVIPRLKGQEKAGMMESLLEELLLQRETKPMRNGKDRPIQFVYASSGDVYNHHVRNHVAVTEGSSAPPINPPPFVEAKPLTTPSTVAGAGKLVDEMLAQAYFDVHGLASTALRLFNVYGPWGLPGSTLFVMAERAILGQDPIDTSSSGSTAGIDDIADYVYIDDAVDAIMAALQYQSATPSAIAINVGTGQGTSLRTIAQHVRSLSGITNNEVNELPRAQPASTVSIADVKRSTELLGFKPQIKLEQGLAHLLAWHYDRAFPYGSGSSSSSALVSDSASAGEAATGEETSQQQQPQPQPLQGMVAQCDRHDTECLRGTPVFMCASECAHALQCHASPYDDVLDLVRAVTASCRTVLYTVALDANVTHIPSARVRVSTQSIAFVQEEGGSGNGVHCNIAFVSDTSPLFIAMAEEESRRSYSTNSNPVRDGVLKHGFWSLIPVAITEFTKDKLPLLSLLPKLSPSKFFADTVEHAVYCDPNVIFDNLPRLIQEAEMQPKHPSVPGATAMLIGNKPVDIAARQRPLQATVLPSPPRQRIQEDAYRMIRMAVIDEMVGDGFSAQLDAGFVVHTLRRLSSDDDDGRMFRCDVFGEVLQWQVQSDASAFEFILGLHDMWSRVMVKRSGLDPWWIGEDVTSVAKVRAESETTKRRLQQQGGRRKAKNVDTAGDDASANHNAKVDLSAMANRAASQDADDEDDPDELEEAESNAAGEHNGFGAIEATPVISKSDQIGSNDKPKIQQRFGERPDEDEEEEDNDFVVDDDDAAEHNPLRGASREDADAAAAGVDDIGANNYLQNNFGANRDPSSYDVWMGVLSSTRVRYFCRIVSMEAVGVYHVTENDDNSASAQ